MPIHPFRGSLPQLGRGVFVAPTAHVAGDVTAGDDVSFWFHAVARGDVHSIRIGARSNVQDGAVLHVTHERHGLAMGDEVVGYGAFAVHA